VDARDQRDSRNFETNLVLIVEAHLLHPFVDTQSFQIQTGASLHAGLIH
jgi:hypothetical protein